MSSAIACAALGCPNRDDGDDQSKGITFHRFPHAVQETDKLRKWLLNVKRKKTIPLSNSYICSEHFDEECFDKEGLVTKLKPDAVPTNLTPENFQQSDAKNENGASRSELDRRKLGAGDKQEGNQAACTANTESVPNFDRMNRPWLKSKRRTKKTSERRNQEARFFKLVPLSSTDPAVRSVVEAECLKRRRQQGRNDGTGSNFPVPFMIMDSTVRPTPESRCEVRDKQGGSLPAVTFWPVSSSFLRGFQEETERNCRAHKLDHPYTMCGASPQEQKVNRLNKRLKRERYYASIHDQIVVIKKANCTSEGKKEMCKKETEPLPSDCEVLDETLPSDGGVLDEPLASDGEVLDEPLKSDDDVVDEPLPSDGEVLEESLIDFPVRDLPEETTSLLSHLFQGSSGDSLISVIQDSEETL